MKQSLLVLLAPALVIGCGGGGSSSNGIVTGSPVFAITERPVGYLPTPTYDGSGQVTEPDVLAIPGGWNGYDYWMTAAPYPHSQGKFENASIWATTTLPVQTRYGRFLRE